MNVEIWIYELDAPGIFYLNVKINYVLGINTDNIRGQDKVQGC